MGKGKLHELLAVETDLKNVAQTTRNDIKATFKSKDFVFKGFIRTYKPFDADDTIEYPEERLELTTTVEKKLDYMSKSVSKYFDALLQKEATNQQAKADLVIDGEVLASDVPATFLLGMEKRLRDIREVYCQIPTLETGVEWKLDEDKGDGIFVNVNSEETIKNTKTIKSNVLYPAQFPKDGEGGQSIPAVIDKWEEMTGVGKYSKTYWSGTITPSRKSLLIERIDNLIRGFKKARQRANSTEVVKISIAKTIFDYINK